MGNAVTVNTAGIVCTVKQFKFPRDFRIYPVRAAGDGGTCVPRIHHDEASQTNSGGVFDSGGSGLCGNLQKA